MRRLVLGAVLVAACASGRTGQGTTPPAAASPTASSAPATAAPARPAANSAPATAAPASPAANSAPGSAAPASPAVNSAPTTAAPAGPAANSAPAPAAPEPLSKEEGALLYATACTSCHTGEFVAGSRISLKGWTAEVAKMRKWGALVEEEDAGPLAAWLAQKYPAGEPPPAAESMTPAAAVATVEPRGHAHRGKAEAGGRIYAQSCAACHGTSAQGLGGGPSLVENPVVQQPARFAKLVNVGTGRMPGFAEVTPAQVDDLLAWLTQAR